MTTHLPPQQPLSPDFLDWWGVYGPKDSLMACPRCLGTTLTESDQYVLPLDGYELHGPHYRCFRCGHEFAENESTWYTWAEARGMKEVR